MRMRYSIRNATQAQEPSSLHSEWARSLTRDELQVDCRQLWDLRGEQLRPHALDIRAASVRAKVHSLGDPTLRGGGILRQNFPNPAIPRSGRLCQMRVGQTRRTALSTARVWHHPVSGIKLPP